jgi:fumarylacetoacetase
MALDDTHDPALRSWVVSADPAATDFPIQNLPLGVCTHARDDDRRVCTAIGDAVLDLRACAEAGLFTGSLGDVGEACRHDSLNALMGLGRDALRALRAQVSRWLRADASGGSDLRARLEPWLLPLDETRLQVPAAVGDYTDFYASVFHATNVGSMFRPDEPLLPNYKYVPIGYHGRASSIVVSGTPVRRPAGQLKPDDAMEPVFAPSRRLDYELEVGAWVGRGNALGAPIALGDAEAHLVGLSLVNDWSARDIQQWEYQPLGPFLAKSFATSVSPWVVTLDALEPFRVPAFARPAGDPDPLPYLDSPANRAGGGIDVRLEVRLSSARMRADRTPPVVLSRSSLRHLYWTFAQLLAHHASNGCNLRPGDLLASGTVSGPTRDSRGCLLELTWRGSEPLTLPTGEIRRFLEDGDEVTLHGACEKTGAARIGFGTCRGTVVHDPATGTSGSRG